MFIVSGSCFSTSCLRLSPLQEALTELEELRRIVPKEALVYFLMGKVTQVPCFLGSYCVLESDLLPGSFAVIQLNNIYVP